MHWPTVHTAHFCTPLFCTVSQRKVDTGEEFDLAQLFFDFTIDTFVEIAFGVQLGNLDREQKHPFAKAFDLGQVSARRLFLSA